MLRGVESGIFECRMGGTKIDEYGLGGSTVSIGGDFVNFTCTRTGQQPEHSFGTYYPAGDIVLDLSTGQFVLDFGERLSGPLYQRLRDMENRIEELSQWLEGALLLTVRDKCPAGWKPYEVAVGKFLRGVASDEAPGQDGGKNEHSHTAWTSTGHGLFKADDGGDHVSPERHRHEISADSNVPEYVAVLVCTQ